MSEGSHMVGGRTYRNVLTTNEVEIKKAGGPEKLTVLTTEKIPGPKAQPPTVGMDLSKMITTHDEPKSKIRVEIDSNTGPGAAKYMDDAFKADAAGASGKKAGRPKKAEEK